MKRIFIIFSTLFNLNNLAFSQDRVVELSPKSIRPSSSIVVPHLECSPSRQTRELGVVDLDVNFVSGAAGHGSWGNYSLVNNQGALTALYLTTPHRSNDTHRFLGLAQNENMFFNRGFGANISILVRPEEALDAAKIEIFEESSESLVASASCRPDYCGLSLAQTVYPGVSLIDYSLTEATRGSPGLGEGVDLLRLQSVSGSYRWLRIVLTDHCGDVFVSRIRFI